MNRRFVDPEVINDINKIYRKHRNNTEVIINLISILFEECKDTSDGIRKLYADPIRNFRHRNFFHVYNTRQIHNGGGLLNKLDISGYLKHLTEGLITKYIIIIGVNHPIKWLTYLGHLVPVSCQLEIDINENVVAKERDVKLFADIMNVHRLICRYEMLVIRGPNARENPFIIRAMVNLIQYNNQRNIRYIRDRKA
jgi:hypothetical protein